MATAPGPRALARSIGTDLTSLLLPLGCAGCGIWDQPICRICRILWHTPPRRCEHDTVYLTAHHHPSRTGLAVWALAPYRHRPRRMVLAWKNHQRPDLQPFFDDIGARLGAAVAADLTATLPARPPGTAPGVLVLPAPSGWRRRLRRQLVVADLARAVARGLTGRVPGRVQVADLLRTPGTSVHRLGAAARGSARRVHLVRPARTAPLPRMVLLVDDVVTTGATLAACRAALQARGAQVAGAVVLAATPRPGSTTWL